MTLRRGPAALIAPGEIAGRVVLANVPLEAHRALLGRVGAPPAAVVLSGLRPGQVAEVAAAWAARGLVGAGADARGGFGALRLVRGE